MSMTNEQREAAWAAWEAEQRAAGVLPPARKAKSRTKRKSAGDRSPWVPCLMKFVDEQMGLGPDRKLSKTAICVWVFLHRYADGRAGMSVSAGVEQLARGLGVHPDTISRAIKELLDRGYLIRTVRGRKGHQTSRYIVRGGGR